LVQATALLGVGYREFLVGKAQEDQPEHRRRILGGAEAGVGAQLVGRGPQAHLYIGDGGGHGAGTTFQQQGGKPQVYDTVARSLPAERETGVPQSLLLLANQKEPANGTLTRP
jgi:hypothetical protein